LDCLPIVIGITWWKLLAFFVMHYTGLILSIVFLAHVVEETTNPSPKLGEMDNTWAIHQLFTTTNFAPKNAIVNWYTGGLNHQIEHIIFSQTSVTYIMVKLQNRKKKRLKNATCRITIQNKCEPR
jgi:linoleoyl-CoA desaturase